jgi:hypothetical protein
MANSESQWQRNGAELNRPSGLDGLIRRLRPVWLLGSVVTYTALFAKFGWVALWCLVAFLLAVVMGRFLGEKIGIWLYPRSDEIDARR